MNTTARYDAEDMREILASWLDQNAEWRRQKAQEYPGDTRNDEAASLSDDLLKSLNDVPREALIYMGILCETDECKCTEVLSNYIPHLGFWYSPSSASDLVDDLIPEMRRSVKVVERELTASTE